MDKEKWAQLCQGDIDVQKEVFLQYKDVVYQTCWFTLLNKHQAEDMLQETFLTAFKSIKKLRDVEAFKSWLCGIAIKKCKAQHRKKKFALVSLRREECLMSTEQSPADHLIRNEEQQLLYKAIEQLRFKERQLLICYYFLELSIEQISEQQGVPAGTIKWRLHQARKKLVKKYQGVTSNRIIGEVNL